MEKTIDIPDMHPALIVLFLLFVVGSIIVFWGVTNAHEMTDEENKIDAELDKKYRKKNIK